MVLDTGAMNRGSGSCDEDEARNMRAWFVGRDLINGVILLPDNQHYRTANAGLIVVPQGPTPKTAWRASCC